MDLLDVVIIGIFVVDFAIIMVGVFIARVVMYRTLHRYGVDPYARGWRYAGSWSWVLMYREYREVCIRNGLSLRYWNIAQRLYVFAKVLTAVWLALVVVQFWRDMVRPLIR